MIAHILEVVGAWIISVISAAGYPGVMFLMAIESACIPLPSEIIMPFSGYLVYTGRFSLVAVATWGAIGCNLGSVVAYEIGYFGGRPLVERYGRYIFLSERELNVADRFFERRGALAVLIARLLPVIRTFIALPAGIARMPFWRFTIFSLIGALPWVLGLALAGHALGGDWNSVRKGFEYVDYVVLALVVVGIVWLVIRRRRGSREPARDAAA